MSLKFKVLGLRFLRTFIAGFLSTVTLVSLTSVTTWDELATALNALLLAGTIGGLSGVFAAGEKWLRWED